jgi:hypothetical protein
VPFDLKVCTELSTDPWNSVKNIALLIARIMPVLETTLKKGGDIHEGQPILDGLYVRIQKIEMNGKLRIVETWSTNGVFPDAECFLRRCLSTSSQKTIERNDKQDDSPFSAQDLSLEETTMPSEHVDAQFLPNISRETFQFFLNALCDVIEPDVSSISSGAPPASPAFIYGKRKYDSANGLKAREKVVESFLNGIERLLNPGCASLLRENITALSAPALNRFMNTFRIQYNAYLSGRADPGETVSKMALKRVLSQTFESLAPYDTVIARLQRTSPLTTKRSNRKGQGSKKLHYARWLQSGQVGKTV